MLFSDWTIRFGKSSGNLGYFRLCYFCVDNKIREIFGRVPRVLPLCAISENLRTLQRGVAKSDTCFEDFNRILNNKNIVLLRVLNAEYNKTTISFF